ncbi:MAG: type II toxin-antitoxin system VapC family toxin [Rhabdochlamydiaceae bacterium]|nr:type II toxin-antitoxin system VapC family toxin [Rhabdochlamydiaceae bacterium]
MAKKTYGFVLDCSITMTWCFEDESTAYTDSILENFKNITAIVPTIWPLEVANVLLLSKKRGRITEVQSASFIDALSALPITVDSSTSAKAMRSIFLIANKAELTIYDAAYLELAIREKIPLMTLDKKLAQAAKKYHVPVNPKRFK